MAFSDDNGTRRAPTTMDGIKLTKADATLCRLGHRLDGTVHLMRHHLVFKAKEREVWACYPVMSETALCGSTIRVRCKDFMFIALEFRSEKDATLARDTIEELRKVTSVEQLYAFVYSPAPLERSFDGWSIYDAEAEYRRLGVLEPDSKWRLSKANYEHKLCRTYPRHLIVPANISDNVLSYAAKFRSKGRLPVLSYYVAMNRCTISRCSQPLVGLKQTRNMQDEAVIGAIWATTQEPIGRRGAQTDHLVVDLRPSTNAIAQVALGGGTEIMDRYKPARKVYTGVDNLHVMRDSLGRVVDALRHSDIGDEPPNPASLERSQWLKHLALLINTSKIVVQQVYFKCSHVVVHCSDGWDRTPQVTSLAMLCLDPYYRTLEGFMVLVEKEWVSFGHQFALRANNINAKAPPSKSELEETDLLANVTSFLSETAKGKQDGPIFQQFLDTAYQLLLLFPTSFEFNERFLRRLLYHSYSCQYGTFLFNSERELFSQEAPRRTRSVWDYFLARRAQFVNPAYEKGTSPDDRVLVVPDNWAPRWWAAAFGRSDSDMNDPEAWRKRPVTKPLSDSVTLSVNTPAASSGHAGNASEAESQEPSSSSSSSSSEDSTVTPPSAASDNDVSARTGNGKEFHPPVQRLAVS